MSLGFGQIAPIGCSGQRVVENVADVRPESETHLDLPSDQRRYSERQFVSGTLMPLKTGEGRSWVMCLSCG